MNVTDSVSKLTFLINGISMAGPHDTIPLESCKHLARAIHTSGWLNEVKAEAWDEGYSTSETTWEHIYDGHPVPEGEMCPECSTGNPYRQTRRQTDD